MSAGAASFAVAGTAAPAGSAGPAVGDPQGTIYVSNIGNGGTVADAIDIFAPGAHGNVAPERVITGPDTRLDEPGDVKVSASGNIYATNFASNTITEYAPGASGDASPICTISGPDTEFDFPDDMSLLPDGTLVVGSFVDAVNGGAGAITVYPAGACGDVSPIQDIAGASTGFDQVDGVGADAAGTVFAASTKSSSIQVFAPGSTGNVAPKSTITGTGVDTPDDVVVGFDGKIYVSNGFGTTTPGVTVYAPGASGAATPAQDIVGSKTDFAFPDDLAVDSAGNIFVTDASSTFGGTTTPAVLEWNAGATGNVAPNAVLAGTSTTLHTPEGVFVAGPPSSATLTTTVAAKSVTLGAATSDTATLAGATTPTGSLVFKLFGPDDPSCSNAPAFTSSAVTINGNGNYSSGSFTPKTAGTYSWQALYSGDSHNPALTTACNDPAETVDVGVTPATVTTDLFFGDGAGNSPTISVPAGTEVFDQANIAPASPTVGVSGTVTYNVYSDPACTQLVNGGAAETLGDGTPESQGVTLNTPGTYYWRAIYSGDSANGAASSTCGPTGEVETVQPGTTPISLATTLSGGGKKGTSISVTAGTAVTDSVTPSGDAASSAAGAVTYNVYSDAACTKLVSAGSAESISTPGTFPPSQAVTLSAVGTYYWQASYTGDATNAAAKSTCGSSGEVETVTVVLPATAISTKLEGDAQLAAKITLPAGQPAVDTAVLSGTHAATATGGVTYRVYSDATCTSLVATAGTAKVIAGRVGNSSPEVLAAGTYYWTASYSGDAANAPSVSSCGSEVLTVKKPAGTPGTAPSIDSETTALSTSVATAHVSTTLAGDLIVAFVAANGPGNALQKSTVSGGGLTWFLISRQNPLRTDTEVWVAIASGKLTNATITATGAIKGDDEVISLVAFKNASGVGPESFASAASGAPHASLTTAIANTWVFAIGADWKRNVAHTPVTGQSIVATANAPGGHAIWVQRANSATAKSGIAVTINDTNPTTDPYDLLLVGIQ